MNRQKAKTKTMTLEELKIEAKKHGYKLIPEERYKKMQPCKCGLNKRNRIYRQGEEGEDRCGLRCKACGFTVWGTSVRSACRKWNKAVSE